MTFLNLLEASFFSVILFVNCLGRIDIFGSESETVLFQIDEG